MVSDKVFKEGDPKIVQYPYMYEYTGFLKKMERSLIGREREQLSLQAAMNRPELCNVILLAEAGTGKTALVQGTMVKDKNRAYLEVDLPKMIAGSTKENEIADMLKQLFHEVEMFRKEQGKEIVLFIDEFHQIVQLSAAAVEVLKPLLADSGTRGIRVIAATTYKEFQQFIASNQPLVERLQRINLREPSKETVIAILKDFAAKYGVADQFKTDTVFEAIYEYTNRYVPSNAQPRKSILMLDSMIGWHRLTGKPMDQRMIANVIYETEGVNVAFRVDAATIKQTLDANVKAQEFATTAIENRLQICCADLNNKDRPMSSFLFTGSTGVGKTETAKQLSRILFNNDTSLIRMDMTEYANDDSLERFREELTMHVWQTPYCIILLDEIEKASRVITRLLLQVLDDGRLIDKHNRIVTFKNAYIIITTNAGSEIYETIAQYEVDDFGSGKLMQKYESLIKQSIADNAGGSKFPPELLGRIDCLVPFQPLSERTMANIAKMKLDALSTLLYKKHHTKVAFDKEIYKYLIQEKLTTQSNDGGARAVVSKIEREVTTAIAKFVNLNPTKKEIFVNVCGDLAIDNKNQLESRAYIKVTDKEMTPEEKASTKKNKVAINPIM